MMRSYPRRWFQITPDIMLYIDFTLKAPVAIIQTVTMTDNTWSPNQDADLYLFKAKTRSITKEFRFNPHNEKDTLAAMKSALDWCVDKLGPPIHAVTRFQILIRCLMPWKWRILWAKGRILGVIEHTPGTSQQEALDSEWESIKRGFKKE